MNSHQRRVSKRWWERNKDDVMSDCVNPLCVAYPHDHYERVSAIVAHHRTRLVAAKCKKCGQSKGQLFTNME